MKTPRSSTAPARSASPSSSSPRSNPPAATIPSASSMFGRIGSGLTPPKYGLRSVCSSVTRILPPASRRLSQPAPAPHMGSTSTATSAALDHFVARHLGRDRGGRVGDRDLVGEEDLRGGGREVLGREAPVVGEDDSLYLLPAIHDVARDALRAATDVLEREVVRYLRPPAVRAEDDVRGLRPLRDRHLSSSRARASSSAMARTSCERSAAQTRSASGVSTTMVSRRPIVTTSRPPPITSVDSDPRSRRAPKPTTLAGSPAARASATSASRRAAQLPMSLQPTSARSIATSPAREAGSITA